MDAVRDIDISRECSLSYFGVCAHVVNLILIDGNWLPYGTLTRAQILQLYVIHGLKDLPEHFKIDDREI